MTFPPWNTSMHISGGGIIRSRDCEIIRPLGNNPLRILLFLWPASCVVVCSAQVNDIVNVLFCFVFRAAPIHSQLSFFFSIYTPPRKKQEGILRKVKVAVWGKLWCFKGLYKSLDVLIVIKRERDRAHAKETKNTKKGSVMVNGPGRETWGWKWAKGTEIWKHCDLLWVFFFFLNFCIQCAQPHSFMKF